MKRTTAEANDGNRYTEGNPSLGIPATVVGAEEMNNIQEELCNVVEAAGITLNGADEDQLLEALGVFQAQGGTSQLKVAIANNQASLANVTGLVFDKTSYQAVKFVYSILRTTSTTTKQEMGIGYAEHDSRTDTWSMELQGKGDADAPLSIVAASGQVQYTSDNMSGASYVGFVRVSEIMKLNQ